MPGFFKRLFGTRKTDTQTARDAKADPTPLALPAAESQPALFTSRWALQFS